MSFSLQQLKVFITVVQTGSLGRASELLHLTQPALSRTLKRLEEQIESPLFERHTKGMQLTAVGETLLPHALVLLDDAQQAQDDIDALKGLTKGTLRIGTVLSAANYVLPIAINELLKAFPNLKIEVIELVWDELADALSKHKIDLAIGKDLQESDEFESVKDIYWTDRSYIICSKRHPLLEKTSLALKDTLSEKWILPPDGTEPYANVKQVFTRHGLPMPDIAIKTRSVILMKNYVSQFNYLSWMPDTLFMTQDESAPLRTLVLPDVFVERTLTVYKRRRSVLSGPARNLLCILQKITASETIVGKSHNPVTSAQSLFGT